ncbi:methyl-accepting chemotaxis protein [Paenibacillus chibensis]|uniref:Methyl-accepting chemotaxis protein n=1 Tax=Paenibacillus chibensis TaxID=59846 RepID=A0ABU6PU31_9BACL|nr:methyl-accepting chemotaxis protein [Paenibacillus chibensis]
MKDKHLSLHKSYKKMGLQGAGLFSGAVLVINIVCFLLGLPVYAGLIISLVLTVPAGYGIAMWLLRSARSNQGASNEAALNALHVYNENSGRLSAPQDMQHNQELSEQVSTHISKIASTIEEVKGSAEMGFYVSDMIKEATLGVTADSNEQTEMIRISSSTVSDVVGAIRHISGSADEAAEAANESSDKATKGQESILQAIERMEEANTTVHSLVNIMSRLDESSRKVVSFVSIIREIAEQTHLLALNAAIEAARFGDEGRGFSVIASEVRSLAEQSSQSAKQVTQVVSDILKETVQAVSSTKEVAGQVDEGLRVVNEAGDSFEFIKLSIGEVAGQMQEVSSSVEEIAAGAEQLVVAMQKTEQIAVKTTSEMNNVTQAVEEHHAIMQQISGATETLNGLSDELGVILNQYREILHESEEAAPLAN